MRVLSQYPKYGIQARPQRVQPLGDGTSRVVQDPIYLKFTPVDDGAMLYDRERYLADGHFHMHGSQQYADEATPVDTVHRYSVLDTDELAETLKWDAQVKAEVEQLLERKAITTPQAILVITGKPVDPPFPSYDSYDGSPQVLVELLVELGYDLEHVRVYEESFGPNRPDFLEALDIGIGALKEQTVSA